MNNVRIGLIGLGAYLPERVMHNAEWANYVDTSDEWITTRTGVERRRIAAPHETTASMAVEAARSALADAGLTPGDVGEIIVTSDTPEVYVPDTACYVQHSLGTGEVPAYDLASSGCAGFLQALDIARSRVHFGLGPVLVIGVELLSRIISWKDRNTCVLFGDAAGAAIVAASESASEILAATAGTDGRRAELLTMKIGGTRHPFTLEDARGEKHQHVDMNGRELFREAVRRMCDASCRVAESAGVRLEDVDLVVPHQANLRIIKAVAEGLRLPMSKFFINIQEYGNTGSASVPLALWDARNQRRVAPGDLILMTSFGAGLHWAAALLRF